MKKREAEKREGHERTTASKKVLPCYDSVTANLELVVDFKARYTKKSFQVLSFTQNDNNGADDRGCL